MFSKSKLMFSVLFSVVLIQPAFAVDETNDTLMPKGMWKDPATGLVWSRCGVGQTWDGATCTGKALHQGSHSQAVAAVKKQNFGGFSDWRLPTQAELLSIRQCSNGYEGETQEIPDGSGKITVLQRCSKYGDQKIAINTVIFPNTPTDESYWSATIEPDRQWYGSNYFWLVSFESGASGYEIESSSSSLYKGNFIRVVRSDSSVNGAASVVAKQVQSGLEEYAKAKQARAEAAAKTEQIRQAAEAKRQVAERKASEEENRRYEQKVTAFRKSVQEGDDTSQGVVVQVKGNLIKVQTNDYQCSQRDYKGDCINRINTPVEKWFKRSEIYPQ